jgi:DNA primase
MKPSEEIKSAVDIVKIVGDYVQLCKRGVNYVAICPFHQEKTPSFAVHAAKQIFHCFGCGVGGDVFKFVMLIENVTFPEALERVAERAGIPKSQISDWRFQKPDDGQAKERAALHQIHEFAAQFFAAQLGGTVEGRAAKAYLTDRGLGDEVLARFRLGYAPSDGHALARRLAEAGFSRDLIEKSGLVVTGREDLKPQIPNSESQISNSKSQTSDLKFHLDRFRRRVIFPITSESGKVVAFAGRSLADEQPKYLNSPETPIYTKSRILYHLHQAGPAIRKADIAILVEGYMDCIALAAGGIENVVASCGTSLTVSQVRLLARYTRRVIVNFDPDSAGTAATERSLGMFLEEGFEVRVLALPGGLDPDSFIRKEGVRAYQQLLDRAPTYLDYLTDRAAAAHDLSTPEGRVRAANAVLPYLAKVTNPLLRHELAASLAERLRLDEELLRNELKRVAQTGGQQIQIQPEAAALKASPAERELLWAFLENPELAAEFLPTIENCLEGLPTAGIFKKLLSEYRQEGNLDIRRLEDSLLPEERRYLFEVQFVAEESPDRKRVISCCNALKLRQMERERMELQRAIERAQREHDRETLSHLLESKLQLIKGLAQLRQV